MCFPKKPFQETMAAFEKDVSSGRSRIAVIEKEGKNLAEKWANTVLEVVNTLMRKN